MMVTLPIANAGMLLHISRLKQHQFSPNLPEHGCGDFESAFRISISNRKIKSIKTASGFAANGRKSL
jgi:hypothetical protein